MRVRRKAGVAALAERAFGKCCVVLAPHRLVQRMVRESRSESAPLPATSPRPARPATWVSSANSFSAARKSVLYSALSAFTTPTSVMRGKSWPFASICVPTRMSTSCACTRCAHVLERMSAAHRIAIDAQHARLRKQLAQRTARAAGCHVLPA